MPTINQGERRGIERQRLGEGRTGVPTSNEGGEGACAAAASLPPPPASGGGGKTCPFSQYKRSSLPSANLARVVSLQAQARARREEGQWKRRGSAIPRDLSTCERSMEGGSQRAHLAILNQSLQVLVERGSAGGPQYLCLHAWASSRPQEGKDLLGGLLHPSSSFLDFYSSKKTTIPGKEMKLQEFWPS